MRKYFLIIVHFGKPTPTDQLVETFLGSDPGHALCIVVDHAHDPYISPHTSPKIKIIRPPKNSGYGGGVNVGLGALLSLGAKTGDIITCLNNDRTYSVRDFKQWHVWWQKNPEPVLAGLTAGRVNLITGRAHETLSTNLNSSFFSLPYLHGAYLAAPFEVFMSLRGLPEHYFMYWEDILLSVRARRRNIPLKLIPTSWQKVPPPSSQLTSLDHLYYLVRNGAVFLQQETSPFWRRYWTIINQARSLFHALRPDTAPVATIRRALHDALQWPHARIDYRQP